MRNPQIAFSRGEKLIKNEGAPAENACYEVAAEQAFSQQPSGIQLPTALRR